MKSRFGHLKTSSITVDQKRSPKNGVSMCWFHGMDTRIILGTNVDHKERWSSHSRQGKAIYKKRQEDESNGHKSTCE